jgi:chorismate mutase
VNPFSVQELAESLRGTNIPVFIKNPINPDLSLWFGAFERFERLGITNLTAIHRGFSVANKKPYRNKPLWEIPIAFKTQRPQTPIICDPSHIAGDRQLIKEVSQRALDLGMSGLMVETHPTPDFALSDAKQQITPAAFAEMVSCLHFRSENTSDLEIDTLNHLRERIDSIDMEILELLGKRMEISREIGAFKKQNEITIFQLERWKEIMQNRNVWGKEFQLTPTFMEAYLEILHKESIRQQNGVMNNDEEA